jgi:Ion channel
MDDLSPLGRILRGIAMVGATGMVQVLAQLALSRIMEAIPVPRVASHQTYYMLLHSVLAVLVLMGGHLIQVTIWAVLYYDWGELGSFAHAFYFSLASFTTLGASELNLSAPHRIAGAVESAVGMLMFGWSTALLVRVVQRTDRPAGS